MKNLNTKILCAGAAAMLLAACGSGNSTQQTVSGLNPADFDSTINGKQTQLVTIKNSKGMEVCLTNYGGRVVSISVPDKNGKMTDVVCSYDNIHQYADTLNSPSDYGSSVGRYANRIKNAKLTVAGKTYNLRANDNGNCLHGGGNTGWMHKVYDIKELTDSSVVFAITSPDGDNGFPGTVSATAKYTVKSDNTLDIVFEGSTDKETVINMTNHSYFNLNGDPSKPGDNMVAYINADKFTPADSLYIPTGEIRSVEGTPMDFRKPHALADHINDFSYDQIKNATGYDHNWCLNTFKNGKGDDKTVAASLYSPATGIMLEVYTNEPGLQMYTGNFQGTGIACKHGIKYPKHVSVCFESQKYPDSPTKFTAKVPGWEVSNPYVKPGQKYYSHLAYKFSVKK
ncbi:MAG: aldose epimerase family protein [Prevotella sp.]|uniref:aldose epimerase family protein n=1 Tax=uncultured Prevotella sp. TaxID=159272 RepID=UPI0025971C3F|nr:aldose epimerase family protein [uncultured Prevotella sp.]MDY6267263.1 aldose epimerase family protein [Prevotella sp.]